MLLQRRGLGYLADGRRIIRSLLKVYQAGMVSLQ
jgi:hypothetical protein